MPFVNLQATDAATVDVFYVHPTTAWTVHGHSGTGNVGIDAAKQMTMHTVGGHASAFSSVGRIFAPKYRQAKLDNFRTWSGDPHEDPHCAAFDLAYSDVRAAFVEYVKTWSEGGTRGLILASHSQGSMHLTRLLRELRDGHAKGMYADEHVPFDAAEEGALALCHRVLREQLVCAYLIGWQLGRDTFESLPLGERADQTDCFVTYCTLADAEGGGASPALTLAGGGSYHAEEGTWCSRTWHTATPVSVNPVTWTTQDEWVDEIVQLGSVGPATPPYVVYPGSVATRAGNDGMLRVRFKAWSDGWSPASSFNNPPGDYHVSDYSLFWADIRANAEVRVAAWHATKAAAGSGLVCDGGT